MSQTDTSAAVQSDGAALIDEIIRMSDFTFDRLPMLDIIGDRMVDNLSAALLDLTGEICEASLVSLDYVPLGEIVENLPTPVLVAVGAGVPFEGEILLAMDHRLLLTATELMLGGTAREINEEATEFTPIELGFGERVAAAILAELQRALSVVGTASLILDRVEDDPDGANIVKPTSLCARMKFSLAMAGHVGLLDVVIPYDAVEPIRPVLGKIYFGNRGEDQSNWQELITGQIRRAHMDLEVVLAEESLPIQKIMSWRPGDTIEFGIEEGKDATMVGAGEPMFKVSLGKRNNGFVAVQITERISKKKESKDVGSDH